MDRLTGVLPKLDAVLAEKADIVEETTETPPQTLERETPPATNEPEERKEEEEENKKRNSLPGIQMPKNFGQREYL